MSVWGTHAPRVPFPAPRRKLLPLPKSSTSPGRMAKARLRHDRFDPARTRISHRSVHVPSPRHLSRTYWCEWRNDFRGYGRQWPDGHSRSHRRVEPASDFFEVATALALKHFAETKIDFVILETGLGGRLDATNAIQSNVSVNIPVTNSRFPAACFEVVSVIPDAGNVPVIVTRWLTKNCRHLFIRRV